MRHWIYMPWCINAEHVHTSFPCEGELNGISTHTTEGINDELQVWRFLHSLSDVLGYLLRSDGKPTLWGQTTDSDIISMTTSDLHTFHTEHIQTETTKPTSLVWCTVVYMGKIQVLI